MAKTIYLKVGVYMFKGSDALYGTGKPFATASGLTVATATEINTLPLVDTAELMKCGLLARYNVNGKNAAGRHSSIRVFCDGDNTKRTAFKTAVQAGITVGAFTYNRVVDSGRRQVLK